MLRSSIRHKMTGKPRERDARHGRESRVRYEMGARAHLHICGNTNRLVPDMLQGMPDTVRNATLICIHKGGKSLFSGAGCKIPDVKPDKNLIEQRQVLGGPNRLIQNGT